MSRAGLRELAPLLATSRYEVLPTASTEQTVLEFVPTEVTVTVTASPVKGLEPTLALACSLAGHGYKAVPPLSARPRPGSPDRCRGQAHRGRNQRRLHPGRRRRDPGRGLRQRARAARGAE